MKQQSTGKRVAITATLATSIAWLLVHPAHGAPEGASEVAFADYFGSWKGAGQIALAGGQVESLKCNAYYTAKDGGRGMGLALRCASPSNNLEIRAMLLSAGQKISGVWEERTFNASGNVSGNAQAGKIDLAINGGGFSGSMLVAMDGAHQKVAIQADGIAVKAINISFSRN